jgi:hypothetical protein
MVLENITFMHIDMQISQQLLLKRMSFLYFSSCTSINSKWIKDHNIRPETLKLVQERAGNTLELIDICNDFLNRTQMAQQLKKCLTNGIT